MSDLEKRKLWLVEWLITVAIIAALLALVSPWLVKTEERILDGHFSDPARQVRLEPSICLVLLDDKSLKEIDTPTTFWAPYFSQVLSSLVEADAAAVGLDWIPYDIDPSIFEALGPRFAELGPLDTNPWFNLYQTIEKKSKKHIVQGIFPSFQGDAVQGQYRPAAELMAMLGPHQMGFLNLSRDLDGVLRRQAVLPLTLSRPLWGATSYPPFAARLAEVSTQDNIDPLDPRFKGQPIPLAAGGLLRINYPPSAGRLPTYSFCDVLRWKPDKLRQLFAAKVVLIGPGTTLFQDLVETPLGEMYGVESHAYTVNTLLTGQYLRQMSGGAMVALCLLAIALGAALGRSLSPLPGLLAILALTFVDYYLTRRAFLQDFTVVPLLHPLLGALSAWGLGTLLRARSQAQEKRHIRDLFGRYVSKSVMEVLLNDPSQAMLGAVGKRKITVLFTDINGFSTHSEKRTPEDIMMMLNNYFEAMNGIIFQYGGTIKQFVGDEIMAMYGAPALHPNPEEAAVKTAVEMIRQLKLMRHKDPTEQKCFYFIKVGIHSGDVILGNVGSAERTEYAAVGDDVNLGSRIMGLTKALQADILISKEVYDKVSHLSGITFMPKGAHQVKGRKEPVEIYQVLPYEVDTGGGELQ